MNGFDERTTILLADDHTLLRDTLKARLDQEPDMTVVASAANADEALSEALRLRPDLIIMDIDMPGTSCFDAARNIRKQYPQTHILFLSAYHRDAYIEQAIAVEAAGYMVKAEPPQKLIDAIRQIMSGATYYSPAVQARLIIDAPGQHRLAAPARTRVSILTERELEVVRYVAKGLSKKEIAAMLNVTPSAVDRHCTRLMAKLEIHDRVELARFAIREGLTEA
jgi:DNA-binding NarL/FixJ family response regulator